MEEMMFSEVKGSQTNTHSNSWHRCQICPNCGSNNLTVTAEHASDGYNGYRCNDCGCEFGN